MTLVTEPTVLDSFLQEQKAVATDHAVPVTEHLDEIQEQIEKKKAQQDKLLDLYLFNTLSKEEWQTRNTKILSEVAALEDEVSHLQSQLADTSFGDADIADTKMIARDISRGISIVTRDFDAKLQIIELLNVRVTLTIHEDKTRHLHVTSILGEATLPITTYNGALKDG